MKSLFYKYNVEVESAYIITVLGNSTSEEFSKRAQDSCRQVDMPFQVWPAFDGTASGEIRVPDTLKDDPFIKMLKVTNHFLTKGEVACALSHISLWARCAALDQPIVILEHDAVMVKRFDSHLSFNSIVYLGGIEWAEEGWPIAAIPPHASDGPNYHFICRAHAYSIDPAMAKNLLAHVLKMGIHISLDMFMRADLFNITHQGLYAYDKTENRDQVTTIKNRTNEGEVRRRNDKLER